MKALAQCVTKISTHNIVNTVLNNKIRIKYHFFPVLCFQVVTVYHQLPDAYEDSMCNSFQLNVAMEKTGAVLALFQELLYGLNINIKHANQKSAFHFRKCSARCRKVLQAYYQSEVSTYIVSHALGWTRCFTFLIRAFPFLRSLEKRAKMVILDIGFPTGFEFENSDLEQVRPHTSDRS